MGITAVHHFSITVTNLNRSVEFYSKLLGAEVQFKKNNKGENLGHALFGTEWGLNHRSADLMLAVLKIGSTRIELIQYLDPPASPYHLNPSVAGSCHIAMRVDDIAAEYERLQIAGVKFHTPINRFKPSKGTAEWKWCYFRDPDGICVELVEAPED